MNVAFIWCALCSQQILSFHTGTFLNIQLDIPTYNNMGKSIEVIFSSKCAHVLTILLILRFAHNSLNHQRTLIEKLLLKKEAH